MAHVTATLAEIEAMLPIIFANEVIQPFVMLGMMGTAKTAFVKTIVLDAFAKSRGVDPSQVALILEKVGTGREACEISGFAIPSVDENGDNVTTFSKPPLIVEIERLKALGFTHFMIFLDELAQASDDIQCLARDLVDMNEMHIKNHSLPTGTLIVGAGNRPTDKSNSKRLLSHLGNTVRIFEVEQCATGFAEYARGAGIHPLVWGCALASADSHHESSKFFAETTPVEYVQACTPRSAANMSRDLVAYFATHPKGDRAPINSGIIAKLIKSNIGSEAASTLFSYASMVNKVPTARDIQHDPSTAILPHLDGSDRIDVGMAMIAADVAMSSSSDAMSADRAFTYIMRLPLEVMITNGKRMLRRMAIGDGITEVDGKSWVTNNPLVNKFQMEYKDIL